MTVLENFYYDKQLKRYMIQFMAIFAGIKVQVGKSGTEDQRLISVPIANSSKDRVVAWIKSEQTQNKLIRVPMFAATLTNLLLAPELRKGIGVTRRKTYMPIGGVYPDDFNVVHQYMPVPYKATFDLTIWASNQDQHYQILEQILSLFDPLIQIQTSDDVFDFTKITTVELVNINFEENVPAGIDRRLIQTTLSFEVPVYMASPTNLTKQYIEQIYLRIGVVDSLSSSEEIISELNAENISYIEIFNAADINLES